MSVNEFSKLPMLGGKGVAVKSRVARPIESEDPHKWIKIGIWSYFILLIFEGALRKWVLPGLAEPLLIIRDPFAVWILFLAWQKGVLIPNKYIVSIVLIGIIGVISAKMVGHKNLTVAIYGARILVFHFPLMFVIGRVFNREDVIKMGKVILLFSIPMAMLIAVQFYSPQSAFVNIGVGGDETGAGFSGALGFFRPPGTFSFTNGTTLFFGMASLFVIYFWLNSKQVNRFILIIATAAIIAAIPLSISRSLLFQVVINVIFAVMASSRKPEYIGRMLLAAAGAMIALLVLSDTSFFQTATKAFTYRFESANETEGGLEGVFLDRYLGGMLEALEKSSEEPFFGYGIGMGTNVGSMVLGGKVTYLISEGEWGRLIGEMGPLMGIAVIFIRLAFCFQIAVASYRKLVMGDLLPWILLGFCLTNIPQGQWAQPTTLGFSTLIGGLILASFRSPARRKPVTKNTIIRMKVNAQ